MVITSFVNQTKLILINDDSRDRKKYFTHKLSIPSRNLFQGMDLGFLSRDHTVNHVTKLLDRSQGARNQHLCSKLEPDKIFRCPP